MTESFLNLPYWLQATLVLLGAVVAAAACIAIFDTGEVAE